MGKRVTAKSAFITSLMVVLTGCTLTPEHITQGDRAERIASDKADMFACQEPVRGTITLSEAMARSLKYNLDLRLKRADTHLAYSEYGVSKFEMLPDFVANAGFLSRSNIYAVRQSSTSDFVSYSQDRHRRVADLQLTWNILDFGVSYIQAKQKGDQYLISLERRRKIEQNLVRDVRYAYFRAVTAQKALREIDPLMQDVKSALRKSRKLESEQTQSPIEALRYQKSLLATYRQLTTLRKELVNARRELGALMNIPPGHRFRLSESINSREVLPRGFPTRMSRLEYIALQNRPEIREEDYRTRISANEITKAKLRMFPGLELTAGINTDTNSFLVNNVWTNYGAQLVWNLMKIFSAPANIERAKKEFLVTNMRRMALSMAILTQVDVAMLRYGEIKKELDVATKEQAVAKRIHQQMKEGFKAKKKSEMQLIQAKTDMVLTKLRYNLTYAEWQNAAGQLLSTVGYDMVYDVDTKLTVRELQRKLNRALNTEPAWVLRHRMPGIYRTAQVDKPVKPAIKVAVKNNQITAVKVEPKASVKPVAPKVTHIPHADLLAELPHPDIEAIHPVKRPVVKKVIAKRTVVKPAPVVKKATITLPQPTLQKVVVKSTPKPTPKPKPAFKSNFKPLVSEQAPDLASEAAMPYSVQSLIKDAPAKKVIAQAKPKPVTKPVIKVKPKPSKTIAANEVKLQVRKQAQQMAGYRYSKAPARVNMSALFAEPKRVRVSRPSPNVKRVVHHQPRRVIHYQQQRIVKPIQTHKVAQAEVLVPKPEDVKKPVKAPDANKKEEEVDLSVPEDPKPENYHSTVSPAVSKAAIAAAQSHVIAKPQQPEQIISLPQPVEIKRHHAMQKHITKHIHKNRKKLQARKRKARLAKARKRKIRARKMAKKRQLIKQQRMAQKPVIVKRPEPIQHVKLQPPTLVRMPEPEPMVKKVTAPEPKMVFKLEQPAFDPDEGEETI